MSNPGRDHGGDITDQVVMKKQSPNPMAFDTPTKSTVEHDPTIAQLSISKSKSKSKSISPSTPSQVTPKKSQRIRDRLSRTQTSHLPPSRLKFVVHDPAGNHLSGKREIMAPKGLNSKSPTWIQAEQVQASLGPKFPSFIKLMLKSHVASCFWMGFPVLFCKSFLPKNDTAFVMEDEHGQQFQVKYLARKTGLSGGWASFVTEHQLLVGDVLIFQLVESYKFKVYILRANGSQEVDGAFGHLNLESSTKENDSAAEVASPTLPIQKKRKRQKSLTLTAIQKKKRSSQSRSVPQHAQPPPLDQPGDVQNSPVVGSDIPRFEIKRFTDFNIVVNGLCIDSELPEDVRVKYYELCSSKKAFLHSHLPQGLYFKLVAGIIGETVSIANSLKACKPTTSLECFAVWEKSLESFEVLGMMVGFLRERLRKLRSLALESDGASDRKRYVKAKNEQSRNVDEIRKFEDKLVELKEETEKFDAIIDTLKKKVESHEAEFQKHVAAPW